MSKLNPKYLVLGCNVLDHEHLSIYNNLLVMSKSEDHLTLNNKMNKVLNELLEHQYKEEVLMEKVKYPALEEHNSNHRMLYELFSSIEEPVIKSHIPPPIAAEILNRCLALHILLEDNKLVDFLIMHHPEIL